MVSLTRREHDCLYWAARGKTSWEIGQILGISERTANFHISNTCAKLAVRTRQAAISTAILQDLLQTEAYAATPAQRPDPRPGHAQSNRHAQLK